MGQLTKCQPDNSWIFTRPNKNIKKEQQKQCTCTVPRSWGSQHKMSRCCRGSYLPNHLPGWDTPIVEAPPACCAASSTAWNANPDNVEPKKQRSFYSNQQKWSKQNICIYYNVLLCMVLLVLQPSFQHVLCFSLMKHKPAEKTTWSVSGPAHPA